VPDSDLFRALGDARAAIVTDEIARFEAGGIRLVSGAKLDADLVVTATGLEMDPAGGIPLSVDGAPVSLRSTMAYRGLMLSGVPNLAMLFGYTNASWTLKVDLSCDYLCRLLRRMDRKGKSIATARADPDAAEMPFLEFTSGYVRRALDRLPRQGAKRPWRLYQNYWLDLLSLRFGRLDDGVLELSVPPGRARSS
jgi:cation diffusion facilitator CzcD-associated flavoprotein CzcO